MKQAHPAHVPVVWWTDGMTSCWFLLQHRPVKMMMNVVGVVPGGGVGIPDEPARSIAQLLHTHVMAVGSSEGGVCTGSSV